MSTATYKVVFLGRLVEGYSEDSVRSSLARAFKLGPQQLAELFSGKEVVIKAGLPIETARQVQTAFVRHGVVTLLRKVVDGDATFADELWEHIAELRYWCMSRLSILYRGCVSRFPAVERHLESILPEALRRDLADGVSRPAAPRRAGGGGLPGKRQLRELSEKVLRRLPAIGARSKKKQAPPKPSTKPRRRALVRLPRLAPILRLLRTVAIVALLAAGVAGAVVYWPSDFQWLVVRAKLGSHPDQLELAERYRTGDGVARDDARAVHWFWVAADRGHARAQLELGGMYEEGRGVSADLERAAAWYGLAAQQGQADARHRLGDLYQTGRGVDRDDRRAALWYRSAAEQGHTEAQNKLGTLYQRGRGVEKDDARAAYWYGKAAARGHAWAQTNLGYLYEHGRGVPRDPKLAALWYGKAAKQGHEAARQRLDNL